MCAEWREGGRSREVDLKQNSALESRDRHTQLQRLPYRENMKLCRINKTFECNCSSVSLLYLVSEPHSEGLVLRLLYLVLEPDPHTQQRFVSETMLYQGYIDHKD